MEWLRCNRCYRMMQGAKRPFSLTQCGHVFCGNCISRATKNCPECGSTDLGTMPLSYPPKYETTQNYFAHFDEIMAISQKNAQFQKNQLSIAMRGFEETEEKYEKLKRSYWAGMEATKKIEQSFQKLRIETEELMKTRVALLSSKDTRSISSGHSSPSNNRPSQRNHGQSSRSNVLPRAPSLSYHSEDQRSSRESLSVKSYPINRETTKQGYNSNSSFLDRNEIHAESSYFSPIPASSGNRAGIFLVPNSSRVPKSVASMKRTTPTKSKESNQNRSSFEFLKSDKI